MALNREILNIERIQLSEFRRSSSKLFNSPICWKFDNCRFLIRFSHPSRRSLLLVLLALQNDAFVYLKVDWDPSGGRAEITSWLNSHFLEVQVCELTLTFSRNKRFLGRLLIEGGEGV